MMPGFRWQDFVDFGVLAGALYFLISWARQARALRIVFGIVILHAAAIFARRFDLSITSWVLEGAAFVAVAMLVLVFQPELRRALTRLDSRVRFWNRSRAVQAQVDGALAGGAFRLAAGRTGALIVVAGRDAFDELVDAGTSLNADVSEPLLEAIFQKTSPIHDGAVVVEGEHVTRAGVVLPLTNRADVPPQFGTRHRAAMGMAERCDALVIVASEERGDVHVMWGSSVQNIPGRAELIGLLHTMRARPSTPLPQRLARALAVHWELRLAAVALTALIWGSSWVSVGTTVRNVSVGVEFSYVPRGMVIAEQSAFRLEAQLRGNPWVMDSVSLSRLVYRFDLSSATDGWRTLRIKPGVLDLPPGIVLDSVEPQTVTVHLVKRQ